MSGLYPVRVVVAYGPHSVGAVFTPAGALERDVLIMRGLVVKHEPRRRRRENTDANGVRGQEGDGE